jgi:hypothetical protein
MKFDTAPYLEENTKLCEPIKRISGCFVFFVIVSFILSPLNSAGAENHEGDHDVKQRLKKVEEREEKEDEEEREGLLNPIIQETFGDKVKLDGGVEFNYEYLDIEDIGDENSGSSSDFFMSTAELALRVFFNEWSKAKIVVTADDIHRTGDDESINLDEAIVTLKNLGPPLYFIGGKTVMPFGVFEDHLIEGTLAEDLYEVDEWGATLGFRPDFHGLDMSLSVYKSPQVIENLQNFDTHEWRSGRQKEDKFRSYIANITLEPLEDMLTVSTFYDNEPGDGSRNRSIGGAFTFDYWKFSLDAEYVTALEREKGDNEAENKESAAVVGIAFDALDSLQLATRYGVFDDDNPGDQDEVLQYQIVTGFNYSLLDVVDFSFLTDAVFSFEYRYSNYEKERDSNATNSQNMFIFQLALGF